MSEELRNPDGHFQVIIRRLAEAAMSVTHHDIGEHEPEYIHEVQSMEGKFAAILRGKIKLKSGANPGIDRRNSLSENNKFGIMQDASSKV